MGAAAVEEPVAAMATATARVAAESAAAEGAVPVEKAEVAPSEV